MKFCLPPDQGNTDSSALKHAHPHVSVWGSGGMQIPNPFQVCVYTHVDLPASAWHLQTH